MKAPPLAYAAPDTIEEAIELLGAEDEARVLAGGQSLVPLLNMRLFRPAALVDLNRVPALRVVDWFEDRVRIGCMARQHVLESDHRFREHVPLLANAVPHVAHLAIRIRGTIGGSIAHADPAAELPVAALALEARMIVRGETGARNVAASDFFRGPYQTAVGVGELLEAIEVPFALGRTGTAFLEVARVHGAFALTAAAVSVRFEAANSIASARIALGGVAATPYLVEWLDDSVRGEEPSEDLFASVAARVSSELDPFGDTHGGPGYRRKLAAVLVRRGFAAACRDAGWEGA